MKRTIITSAVLSGAALDELKGWLAITATQDDAPLLALLHAALEMCEAFTGRMPLEATCEEVLPACGGWRSLSTKPVQAITQVEGIPADGARFALPSPDYAIDLDADGGASLRLLRQGSAGRIVVRFVAGLAPGWAELPDGIRHGVIRLAAHHYRQRDLDGMNAVPPAAVAALWRPWRRMQLA